MNITLLIKTLLASIACIMPAVGNPANGSSYPQTASQLWPQYQSAIENDALNTVSYQTENISYPFLSDVVDVTMEVIRYDLGALQGTNADGSAKTVNPKIAAFIAYPADASPTKKYPAIVNIHGGGQIPGWFDTYQWAARGYVVISINWGGKHMNPMSGLTLVDGLSLGAAGANFDNTDWDGLAAGFARDPSVEFTAPSVTDPVINAQHFQSEGIENQTYSDGYTLFEHANHPLNASFLLNSYAARRAITLLINDPKVDSTKIGVMGFSMGGITTTITGTDPRITCIVPSVGGTSYDYDDYDRLPGETGKDYRYNNLPAQDNPTFDWYKCVVSQQNYWPDIQVPSLFINGTNDFNAPFDHVQPSLDLLPAGVKGLSVNTPHANHILASPGFTSNVLWMKQYLKNDFTFPSEPASNLNLAHSSGVPVFSVTPDQSVPSTVKKVEVYYGYDRFPLERFWHKGIAVETSSGTWEAVCPVFDSSEPLIVFAEVFYDLGYDQNIGFNTRSREFSVSTETQFVNNKTDGTISGILIDNSRSRMIDTFEDGTHDWYNYALGSQWQYGSYKIGAPRYKGPQGASLAFDVVTSSAGNSVAVSVRDGWHNSDNTYRAYVSLPVAGTNSITLSPSQFIHTQTGGSLTTWDNIEVIDFHIANSLDPTSYPTGWTGNDPLIPNLRWVGGAYTSGNTNQAPLYTSENFTKLDAVESELYADTLAGAAVDPEAANVTYTMISGPSWLTVTSNGALSGTPVAADSGTNRWIVEVSDPLGAKDYAELEIEVAEFSNKVVIYSEDFESSSPATNSVGTSAYDFGWDGTSFSTAAFSALTLDVKVVNGTYSNAYNNLPTSSFTGGRFYGSMGSGQTAFSSTGESFVTGTSYDLSFAQYQPMNTPFGGRAVTAEIYDVNTAAVYATQTFSAVSDQNVPVVRILSYTATAAENGNIIGLRLISGSDDKDDASTTFDENNFYGVAIDNIELCATSAVVNDYDTWSQNSAYALSASQRFYTADADGDGIANGIEAAMGTDPSVMNTGLCSTSMSSSASVLSHPVNASPPSDLITYYQWSTDLTNWYLTNGIEGPPSGLKVTTTTNVVGNTATVTATPSVPHESIFIRFSVFKN